GTPSDLSPAHSGVLQYVFKSECTFANSIDRVRFVERHFYNRQQLMHFDSDVGHYVGHTLYGEIQARNRNNLPEKLEHKQAVVDRCRHKYEILEQFLMNRRGPSPSQSPP
ncbi:HB24 protein, partial [Sakesphorus luctuosus]|nr:HB24 protein [Sakesphorus luctuosus]